MSFIASTEAELLKTKRSAAFWLSIVGAALIPFVLFLVYFFKPEGAIRNLKLSPWEIHFAMGCQIMNSFLFPMYIILICTLIPQIEYRNNTWKQVFSSPQSYGTIYFSKFLSIHIMIVFFYFMFNIFMILSAVVANLLNTGFNFFDQSIALGTLLKLNVKTYISILAISAIQYCLSLRFKNFITPVGVGLALLIGSVIALNLSWEHIDKMPYAYPVRTLDFMIETKSKMIQRRYFLENHEWNSIGYFIAFTAIGFLDMRYRKEKG